jgi:plasmid stabilization system protein ParE
MATLKLTERAHGDLERIFEFVARTNPNRALATIESIEDAVQVLVRHPLIGRPAEEGRRELVICRGRNAHVALYRWFEAEELVLVLAIRSAREAGYSD